MRLKHLSLTNFRIFARLAVDIPGGLVLLVGGNAQGKTSLLEAIYYLATFTSFQASSDRQLLSFSILKEPLSVARIVADFELDHRNNAASFPNGEHRIEIRLIQEENGLNGTTRFRKEILVDGVKRKMSEAVGFFNAVLFLPQMLNVVEGSPEGRRRYLNLSLSQVWPHYAENLVHYQRSLTQRNALLKQLAERGGDIAELEFWDQRLAKYGSQIIYARNHAIKELEQLAAQTHLELTREKEVLRLSYLPSFDPLKSDQNNQIALPLDTPVDRSGISEEDIYHSYLEALNIKRSEEIARGMTTIGPHRDEIRFLGNSLDLGLYGSRGQVRTVMLSMKLAEAAWMEMKTGQTPVLLLDEILAELDPQRRGDLLGRLIQSDQALTTTTDLDLFSGNFLEQADIWEIEAGRLLKKQHI